MAQIEVEIDPVLKKKSIEMQLVASSKEEAGDSYIKNQNDVQQTSIFGVLVPLIKINNTVIDFMEIEEFTLRSRGPLPELSLSFYDHFNLIENFSTPGNDNYVLVQIIPPFDNAYKKINLEFYISDISITNKFVSIVGIYKVPEFLSSRFKSLGYVDTHELCREISTETGLGFASNVKECSDARWVYCDHISYNDLLRREIRFSGGKTTEIFDWWVDFWDYINLVNIYERYNSIDRPEDMKIWVGNTIMKDVTEGNKITPFLTHCILTNSKAFSSEDLTIVNYSIVNPSGSQVGQGTDKVYSIYDKELGEYKDVLIQDGDVQQDIFRKYEYVGETYGEYNYLLSEKLRNAYIQKINTETLEVTLANPLLGITRGSKVDVVIYDDDTNFNIAQSLADEAGVTNPTNSNISLNEEADGEPPFDDGYGGFHIKKQLSGQYYVLGVEINYSDGNWENVLTLVRPASSKYNPLLSLEDNTNQPRQVAQDSTEQTTVGL